MKDIDFAKDSKSEIQMNCHEGVGGISFREIFRREDFFSNLQHLHETIIYPHSSIGYHLHQGNEEVYYIISGSGTANLNEKSFSVLKGDSFVVRNGGSHGIVNNTDQELKILVLECNYVNQNDKI